MQEQETVDEGLIPPGCSLWFLWVLSSIFGSLFGWFAGWRSSFAVPGVLATAAIGAVMGLFIGTFQWLVLRGRMRNALWWAPATLVGWGVGFTAGVSAAQWFGLTTFEFGILTGFITGVSVGLMQWIVLLRQKVADAYVWIPVTAFAWTSGMFYYQPGASWSGALYGALSGIITATAMLWLLHRPVPE